MTKKDYIVLAKGMRMAYIHFREKEAVNYAPMEIQQQLEGFSNAITGVMNALKSDNPNFNETIFINAVTKQ